MDERVRAAASAAEADDRRGRIAWVLILIAAVAVVFLPPLAVLLAGAAAVIAHMANADTPRIAAVALLVIAVLMLLFQGVGGILGDEDIFQG